jgi:hypothetical protein
MGLDIVSTMLHHVDAGTDPSRLQLRRRRSGRGDPAGHGPVHVDDGLLAGRMRSTSDLASQVCDPRYLNPQTVPFHVEGAETGDALAVYFVSIEPRETWGVSTTVPFFDSLTGTRRRRCCTQLYPS